MPLPSNMRFACECGERFTEGYMAVGHSFDGHQVVQERFYGGQWHFAGLRQTVAEMIVERLRLKGESVSGFVRRLNERMDAVNKEDDAQEAERAAFLQKQGQV